MMNPLTTQVAVDTAKEVAADTAKDWLFLLLAGLGITLAWNQFLGGLVLAMAAAAIARNQIPKEQRTGTVWSAMGMAVLLAVIAAGVISWREINFIPAPLAMCLVGFASRAIIRTVTKMIGRVEERADDIVDAGIDRVLSQKDDDK